MQQPKTCCTAQDVVQVIMYLWLARQVVWVRPPFNWQSGVVHMCLAFTSASKSDAVLAVGADQIITQKTDMLTTLGEKSVDLVVDNVAGANFPRMLKLLRRGGKYASSGAIAGPIVSLDMRDMYLKDITLFGTTAWDEIVFPNLISYIEADEIRPLLAKAFPLLEIAKAQAEFIKKEHVGNFALIPPN
jgi:NADPH:quinone reductase-like Zn-dependent oxidoreductase